MKEQTLWVEPWGRDSIRVRATPLAEMPLRDWSLLLAKKTSAKISIEPGTAKLVNGKLTASVDANSLWRDDWLYPRRMSPGNSKTIDAEMTGPVTRYARALLELHTLGAGNFSDKDVSETARIFTGWSIDPPAGRIAFRFYPPAHDAKSATLIERLGRGIPGADLEKNYERTHHSGLA